VEFLLRANFYVFDVLTLTSSGRILLDIGHAGGSILLEIGHAGGSICHNLSSSTEVQLSKLGYPGVIKNVMVKPAQFETAGRCKASTANKHSLTAAFVIAILVGYSGTF